MRRLVRFPSGRSHRRWRLALAYSLLVASCESPFAPGVVIVSRVEITPAVLELAVGATTTILARVYDDGAALLPNAKVFWSSQNPSVVTIDQNGIVSAVTPGTAQIAASSGGMSQTIAVTVEQRPIALIRVTPAAGNVVAGETLQLLAEALDGTGSVLPGRLLTFTSDAPAVASVSIDGLVTGLAVGTATISASGEGRVGSTVITVLPPPIATLTISPDNATITAGSSELLTATARDAQGTVLLGRALQWGSSNDAVATVSSGGLVTAIAPGVVTVTVSAPGGGPQGSTPTASIPVTVLITPAASATLAPGAATVLVSGSLQLTVNLFALNGEPLSLSGRTIGWSSSNPGIATVDNAGLVTGLAVGATTITVTVTTPGQPGNVQATSQISISNQPVASVSVDPIAATVHVGPLYARAFSATAMDGTGQPLGGRAIIWTSSNLAIATVDAATGLVTGIAPGPVQIRATAEGVQGVANVTVDLVPAVSVTVNPPAASLTPPAQVALAATPRDSAGNVIDGAALGGRATAWSSGTPAIATVDADGVVTSVAEGVATIAATIGGAIGTSIVTVSAVPIASISVTPSPVAVIAGQTAQLTATAFDGVGAVLTGRTFTWLSSSLGVATVDQNGLITAVSSGGPINVTASAEGKTGIAQVTVLPRPPVALGMATQPSAVAQSGVAMGQQPVVQLLDAINGAAGVAGIDVTATLASGAGALTGTTVVTTNVNGVATFVDLVITGPAGPYTIGFAAPGLTGVTSSAVVLGAGGASQVAMTTEPDAAATNGVAFVQQPVVHLRDLAGNPVALGGVDISAVISSGTGTLAGTLVATTDGTGTATFLDLAIVGQAPGPFTIDFTAAGLVSATSQAITLSAGAATDLGFAVAAPATATNGVLLAPQPVVRITDSGGNPIAQAGVTVTAALQGAGATLGGTVDVVTDVNGEAAFTDLVITGLAGPYSIAFTAPGFNAATTGTIDLVAGAVVQLGIVTQPSAAPLNDVVFAEQPVIQLQDASGNPVTQAGVDVTVAITAGGAGALTGTLTATTDAAGLATFLDLRITGVIGIRTLDFTSAPLTPVTSANVDVQPGAATQVALTTAPSATANSGESLTTQPVAQLQDVSGNNVSQGGIDVLVTAAPPGTVTLTGDLATTNGSGTAVFTALTLTGTADNYTLTFSAGALTPAVSAAIALSAGSGSKLSIERQPSATVANGAVLAVQPQVRLRDASNNPVTQAGVQIFANIASGGGTLGGTTSALTNGGGTATFANLSITGTVGKKTLLFSAAGYLSVESDTIIVTAGPATQISLQTQPSASVINAVDFPQQPAVLVRDASNNPVAGVVVTAAVQSGAGVLGGTLTATTNAAGVATFANLRITGLTGDRTLSFTIPGPLSVTSGTVTVGAGAPASLTISTAPSATVMNAVAFPQQPAIQVNDVSANPVAGILVTASINTGAGVLGGTLTATTNAAGTATFTNLMITGLIGDRTLNFAAATLSVNSGTITVNAGLATSLTITQQPSSPVTNDVAFATQPAIELRDVSTNLVSGVVVTAAIFSGGGTLGGTVTATSNGAGIATFANLRITGTIGDRILSFSVPTPATVNSGTVTVNVGAPTVVAIQQQPSANVTNAVAFPEQPTVRVTDISGNPVAGVLVTAGIQTGAVSLGGTLTIATDGTGLATFTDLVLTGLVGDRTLNFSIAGPVVAVSNTVTVGAGAATSLTLTTAPSANATNDAPFAQQPAVRIADVSGNGIANVVVTASINTGAGVLGGTLTATTNAGGTATFVDLKITGATGDRTLTFAGASLSAISGTITVAAGTATQISIQTPPSGSTMNAVAFAQQPVLLVRDVSNNVVSGVQVTASVNSGAGVLGGTLTATSDGSGLATFSTLMITGLIGDRTLAFTIPGPISVVSGTISITPGNATQLVLTTPPSTNVTNAVAFPQQPVVQLRDVSGNDVPTQTVAVTAVIASGAGALGGTTVVNTDANGTASFGDLTLTGLIGDRTLNFTSPGLTTATSGTITVAAGALSQVLITQQPSAAPAADAIFPQQPIVQLADVSGNAVAAVAEIVVTLESGTGALAGTLTVNTAADGSFAFTDLAINNPGATGDHTLRFTATVSGLFVISATIALP